MNKNKKTYIALGMTGAITLLAGSFAWLTQDADVTNHFSTGEGKTYEAAIVETVEGDEEERVITNADNHVEITVPEDFKPGDEVKKEVSFRNTGDFDQLIRIKLTNESSEEIINMWTSALENEWQYNEADGYYYYKSILNAGEETSKILEKVLFDTEYNNGVVNPHYSLKIELNTVQVTVEAAVSEFGAEPSISGDAVTWSFN